MRTDDSFLLRGVSLSVCEHLLVEDVHATLAGALPPPLLAVIRRNRGDQDDDEHQIPGEHGHPDDPGTRIEAEHDVVVRAHVVGQLYDALLVRPVPAAPVVVDRDRELILVVLNSARLQAHLVALVLGRRGGADRPDEVSLDSWHYADRRVGIVQRPVVLVLNFGGRTGRFRLQVHDVLTADRIRALDVQVHLLRDPIDLVLQGRRARFGKH